MEAKTPVIAEGLRARGRLGAGAAILILLAALLLGFLTALNPWLWAAGMAMLAIGCWVVTLGRDKGYVALIGYLVPLIVLPTFAIRVESSDFPLAVSDLALVFVVLTMLVAPARQHQVPPHLLSLGKSAGLFILAVVLSTLFIPFTGVEGAMTESVLRLARLVPSVMLWLFVVRWQPQPKHLQSLVTILAAAISVQAILGIVQFLTQTPMTLMTDRNADQTMSFDGAAAMLRAQGSIGESSSLAHLVGIGILLALFSMRRGLGWRNVLFFASLAVCSACMVFTYSRGMLLSLALGGLVYIAANRSGRSSRLLAGLAVAAGLMLALQASGLVYWTKFGERFIFNGAMNGPGVLDAYMSGRIGLWGHLAQFIVENPVYILFGIGYRALPFVGGTGAAVGDNNYLRLLVECGLLGLSTMLILLYGCFRGAWLVARSAAPDMKRAGALLAGLWSMHASFMLVGDAMTYWRSLPLLFILQFTIEWIALSSDANP